MELSNAKLLVTSMLASRIFTFHHAYTIVPDKLAGFLISTPHADFQVIAARVILTEVKVFDCRS